MKRVHGLTAGIACLIVLVWAGPSWGQVPLENDKSDGDQNTAGGNCALGGIGDGMVNCGSSNTNTGATNTAYGFSALDGNTTGSFNTAVGASALGANGRGHDNTALGTYALFENGNCNCPAANLNLSSNNIAVGVRALELNTSGFQNIAIGTNALKYGKEGRQNTAVGYQAGTNAKGRFNTIVGASALANLDNLAPFDDGEDSNGNIAIGMAAGINLVTGAGNIYLGNPGPPGDVHRESFVLRVGNQQRRTFIAGVDQPVVGPSAMVFINPATRQVGTQSSSARYKRDIEAMGMSTRGLLQLRPVTFSYKESPQGGRQYGLIAEEVVKVYPELVIRGADGEVESVRYDQLIPMLLNELQRQERQQAELTAQNLALAERLERLETVSRAAAPQRR